MSSELKRVLTKYRSILPKEIIKRDLAVEETSFNKATAIVGPRRCGKTYFMYSLAKRVENPIIVNFEDNLLVGLSNEELRRMPDYAKELFGDSLSFYLDEVHGMDKWERLVLSLLNENSPVTVTGSNSKLLSREIASSLRGKSLSYLLLPLSFREFLRFNGIRPEKNFESSDTVFKLKKLFAEYFKHGGFPEVVLGNSIELKSRLINSYFDSVLYSDLVDRLSLKNKELVEICMKYLLNLYGNTFSISSFEGYLKALKMPYSLEDVYVILRALEEVYMLSYVREYSKSHKKRELSKAKVYLFDVGYIEFLANEPDDVGRRLENLVFIELFRRQGSVDNKGISYFRGSGECDFVVPKEGLAVQVCKELNSSNQVREISGLLEAMDALKLKQGLILTYDQERDIRKEGKRILIRPIWKWMLE